MSKKFKVILTYILKYDLKIIIIIVILFKKIKKKKKKDGVFI